MHDMDINNRDNYDNRDYRDNYRNYRDDYRDDYREYDRRGGRTNNRNYRVYGPYGPYGVYGNYREEDFHEEIENAMYDAKECQRKMEDLADMAKNSQDKNTLMKISQREKDHYTTLKETLEK